MTHPHQTRAGSRRLQAYGLRAVLIGGASALAIGLFGAPGAALAQDAPCLSANGVPILPAPPTDQGAENAGGDNTTCSPQSAAFGSLNNASGQFSSAVGFGNDALGLRSNAFGLSNTAAGERSVAFGFLTSTAAGAISSLAVGTWYDTNGDGIADYSEQTVAFGAGSAAIGTGVHANGFRSFASGLSSFADGDFSTAVGIDNNNTQSIFGRIQSGLRSSAFGYKNTASGENSVAIGNENTAEALGSTAIGRGNSARARASSAFGRETVATGEFSSAFGYGSVTGGTATGGLAVGGWYDRNGNGLAGAGEWTVANGLSAVAVGASVRAMADYSAAFGIDAMATAKWSTAIGFGAVADREYALSVGSAGLERNIIHVANAVQGTDAVNYRQMVGADNFLGTTLAAILGGGMTYTGTVGSTSILYPSFSIQGAGYSNVGAAFAAVDARLTSLATDISNVSLTPGPQGPQGPGNPLSPGYDDASRATLTLEGAAGTRVANVADGTAPMDAVNRRQMDAGDAATLTAANTRADAGDVATLASARTYADAGDAATLTSARTYADAGDARTLMSAMAYTDRGLAIVDARLNAQGQRIDRMGAMGAAQLNMAMNAAGGLPGKGRLAVGIGFQNGEEALSVGYGRRLANGVSFSFGGAFARGENSGGFGMGFDF